MSTDNIILKLTKAESLVLFDFLARYEKNDKLEIKDQAEKRVLLNLQCDLEKILVESFREDYLEIIRKACDEVRNGD